MRIFIGAAAALIIAGCTQQPAATPADDFIASLNGICGNAYEGKLVSTDDTDASFAAEKLVMHVRACSADEIRIPFHVSDNRSRSWVITRIAGGLRLKHDHRHEDGSEDVVTQYGGDTASAGTALRQVFPVDQYSIDLFTREGLSASVTNIWAVEIDDETFAYELRRENRFFRVEFDLTQPVAAPPPPWGAN